VKHQGLAVLLVVLGICALEAWQGRSWLVIAVWLCFGIFVMAMDRPARRATTH
jgi:hypothetical protein